MDFAVPHFRGCSGELNLAPRAYHSGDFEEIGWILGRLRPRSAGAAAGGRRLAGRQCAAALGPGGRRQRAPRCGGGGGVLAARPGRGRAGHRPGFNRQVYTRMFLRTMKPKALAKLAAAPGPVRREAPARRARPVRVRQPVHRAAARLSDTEDYWARASAKPHLARIRVPALVLNARNDPFVPGGQPARAGEVGRARHAVAAAHGGHVGFPGGAMPPGHVQACRARWRLAAQHAG
jgi:predicted alpha/beta-fold hydrolase